MWHMFPCVMEKPAFPTRDEPLDKTNLFVLSGRAVSRCRHKSLLLIQWRNQGLVWAYGFLRSKIRKEAGSLRA